MFIINIKMDIFINSFCLPIILKRIPTVPQIMWKNFDINKIFKGKEPSVNATPYKDSINKSEWIINNDKSGNV